MTAIAMLAILSTIFALIAIDVGIMIPALSMGRIIAQALDSIASYLCFGGGANCAFPQSLNWIYFKALAGQPDGDRYYYLNL